MAAEEEVIEIDLNQLKKMKVQELRKQASELGLETKGTKAELLGRIEKYLKEQEEDLLDAGVVEEGEEEEEGETDNQNLVTVDKTAQPKQETTPTPQEATPTEDPAAVPDKPEVKAVSLSGGALTSEERMAKRADKFGSVSSEEAKKLARAKRFGVSTENGVTAATGEELEKMKKRAERFGTSVAPSLTAVEDNERKQKRRERFGLATADLPTDDRKKARLERFGAAN